MQFAQLCVQPGQGAQNRPITASCAPAVNVYNIHTYQEGKVLYRGGAPGYASTIAQQQASQFGGAYYMKTYSKPSLKKHAALKQVTFSSH
jgi:hypothetical protein